LIAGAACLLGLAAPSFALDPPGPIGEQQWAYELWHDTMSPYCPGRTLAECPSPQADELRLWILTQAAAGASREEVEGILFERFGDSILTAPRAEGWGLAAYVVPVLGFLLGGVVVWLVLRRMVGTREETGGASAIPPGPLDPEIQRRIDEEFRS
jgi:cytochrome c-type biogenesis protein CcmH/NrfF